METTTIILTVMTAILVPAVIAEVRYRSAQRKKFEEQGDRLTKIESFIGFMQTYMLKGAVLEFHGNPNKETDEIIEKINADQPVSEEELNILKTKLQNVAAGTPDKKKQLKAERTLELLDKISEWNESIERQSRARNSLFNA